MTSATKMRRCRTGSLENGPQEGVICDVIEAISVENAAGFGAPCVQHADVEPAEACRRLVDHPFGITLVRQVTDDEHLGTRLAFGLCTALRITTGDDYPCTFLDKHGREFLTESGRGAEDKGSLPGKTQIHRQLPNQTVRMIV